MPTEYVGPFPIPAEIPGALRALADAAGTGPFVPYAVCATMLAWRLSRGDVTRRLRVTSGGQEALTPVPDGPWDPALTFRAALRGADDRRAASPGEVAAEGASADAAILVSDDGLQLYVRNMTDSADTPTPQCWARMFLRLLTGMTHDPDALVAACALLSEAERDLILCHLNSYRVPRVRHRTLAAPFEEQAERTPHAVALEDEAGDRLSYRELNTRANQLACFLLAHGAGPGTRVGICLSRSISQVIAIYAAVKTGAAYVPLDPELPDGRLGYMLADTAPLHVLTDPACRHRIPDGGWQVLDAESPDAPWVSSAAANPVIGGSATALQHILYTSGSTGRPKGVAYPADGALAHLMWMQRQYPFGEGDTALYKTSPGFDVSIWELFWPLYHGARLVICRPGGHRDPAHLARLTREHGISTIFLSPTVMAPYLERMPSGQANKLRWALCAGEPVTRHLRDTFYSVLPDATLVNAYGPTEAGAVTDMPLPPDPGASVPLGRPAGHFRLTLLGENLGLVPVGMPGEAYIGGDVGLAQAYWGAPGLTAERFVADPYGPAGSRMYRTGDLLRYRDDGVAEYLGRIDRQVKIRGLRIEPGEIESVLAAHPLVAECAVIAQGEPARLLAFIVAAGQPGGGDVDTVLIADHAATLLPRHMRPEHIMVVPSIPATVNGKIDKAALASTWEALARGEREIVSPADEVEASLAEIYGRLLGIARVSVLDTFPGLGGNSLLAIDLLNECLASLQAKPDLTELLSGTIRDVAASIRRARAGDPAGRAAQEEDVR